MVESARAVDSRAGLPYWTALFAYITQNGIKDMKFILALGLIALAGCGSPAVTPTVAPTQPSSEQKPPTATEVFDLRQKCFELGRKLDEETLHGSAVEQDMVSNYNTKNNRCYVTLEDHPGMNLAGTPQWYDSLSLHDGQTKEMLASTNFNGNPLDSRNKGGMVVGRGIGEGIGGYVETQAYIDKLMEREGEKQ